MYAVLWLSTLQFGSGNQETLGLFFEVGWAGGLGEDFVPGSPCSKGIAMPV